MDPKILYRTVLHQKEAIYKKMLEYKERIAVLEQRMGLTTNPGEGSVKEDSFPKDKEHTETPKAESTELDHSLAVKEARISVLELKLRKAVEELGGIKTQKSEEDLTPQTALKNIIERLEGKAKALAELVIKKRTEIATLEEQLRKERVEATRKRQREGEEGFLERLSKGKIQNLEKKNAELQTTILEIIQENTPYKIKKLQEERKEQERRLEQKVLQLTEIGQKLEAEQQENEVLRKKLHCFSKPTEDVLLVEVEALGVCFEKIKQEKRNLEEKQSELEQEKTRWRMRCLDLEEELVSIKQLMFVLQEGEKGSLEGLVEREQILAVKEIELLKEKLRQKDTTREKEEKLAELQLRLQEETSYRTNIEQNMNLLTNNVMELEEQLRTTKTSQKNTEEDLNIFKAVFDCLSETKKDLFQNLQKQLDLYKRMLRCSICEENQKGVLLLKCKHTFCHQCIEKQLCTRQRKCPACGDSFGASDVTKFFL